jgi:hypothetical protein
MARKPMKKFGTGNQGRFRFEHWPAVKYYWLHDTMSSRATTLAEALGMRHDGSADGLVRAVLGEVA